MWRETLFEECALVLGYGVIFTMMLGLAAMLLVATFNALAGLPGWLSGQYGWKRRACELEHDLRAEFADRLCATSWWFTEHMVTHRLLLSIGSTIQQLGEYDNGTIREAWRRDRERSAADRRRDDVLQASKSLAQVNFMAISGPFLLYVSGEGAASHLCATPALVVQYLMSVDGGGWSETGTFDELLDALNADDSWSRDGSDRLFSWRTEWGECSTVHLVVVGLDVEEVLGG